MRVFYDIIERKEGIEHLLSQFNIVDVNVRYAVAEDIKHAKKLVRSYKFVVINDIDSALASLFKLNSAFPVVNVNDISFSSLKRYRKVAYISERASLPLLLASFAKDIHSFVSPYDRASLGMLIGLSPVSAYASVSWRWKIALETYAQD